MAIKNGLPNYLRAQLADELFTVNRQMLNLALCPQPHRGQFVNKEVVGLLLKYEANPNERPTQIFEKRVDNQSPWQNAITYLATEVGFLSEDRRRRLVMRWHDIIKLLLRYGAKANTLCAGPIEISRDEETGACIINKTTRTPKQVVEELYKNHPRELAALVRLLDSKGATKTPEDDEVERRDRDRPLENRKHESSNEGPSSSDWTERPRLAEAEDLSRMVAQETKALSGNEGKRKHVLHFRWGRKH